MGRERKQTERAGDKPTVKSGGRLTIDRARRSGHYQGTHHSEVYRDGKVFVYTAWDDNAEERGQVLDFDEWVASHQH